MNNKIEVFGNKSELITNIYFIDNLKVFSFMFVISDNIYEMVHFNFKEITENELKEDILDREGEQPLFYINKLDNIETKLEFFNMFSRFINTEMYDQEAETFTEKYPEYRSVTFLNNHFYSNDEKINVDFSELKYSENYGMFRLLLPIMKELEKV